MAKSIELFGFRQPIVIDAEGVIVCGHVRWKAAKVLGLETVPVHVAADLTPEQIRAYRLADNRSADLADWDDALLAAEMQAVRDLDGTIDLVDLGWTETELAKLTEELDQEPLGDVGATGAASPHLVTCPECGHTFQE